MQRIHNKNAPEMVGRKTPLLKHSRKEGIDLTTIDTNFPDEKYGENIDGKKKFGASKIIVRELVPLQLWCYALEYYYDLITMIIPGMVRNKGINGYEILFGNTPEIIKYVKFKFYE